MKRISRIVRGRDLHTYRMFKNVWLPVGRWRRERISTGYSSWTARFTPQPLRHQAKKERTRSNSRDCKTVEVANTSLQPNRKFLFSISRVSFRLSLHASFDRYVCRRLVANLSRLEFLKKRLYVPGRSWNILYRFEIRRVEAFFEKRFRRKSSRQRSMDK